MDARFRGNDEPRCDDHQIRVSVPRKSAVTAATSIRADDGFAIPGFSFLPFKPHVFRFRPSRVSVGHWRQRRERSSRSNSAASERSGNRRFDFGSPHRQYSVAPCSPL